MCKGFEGERDGLEGFGKMVASESEQECGE